MILRRVVLPAPFDPMRPVKSSGRTGEGDVAQDLPAAEPDADAVQPRQFRPRPVFLCGHQSFWVEILSVTALFRALTSASIQDW